MIPTVRNRSIERPKIVLLSTFLVFVGSVLVSAASVPHSSSRIIGGTNASIVQFPYQASIRRRGTHICGGSIFHYLHVLSAAHCGTTGSVRVYSVRVGTDIVNVGGTIVSICSIKLHEKFGLMTMEGDIAIFTLCTPLTFSEKILPVALPNPWDVIHPGSEALVSGWGYAKPEGGPTSRLQAIRIPIISVEACDTLYGEIGVTKTMICAGYVGRGEKDACQGDSGGPLLADGKLFGIVSWGYGCADPNFPGVYTNVAKYRAWIRQTTNY